MTCGLLIERRTNMSSAYIDFKHIKETVSVEKAVQLLGLNMKRNGDQLRSGCPRCRAGGERALAVNTEKNSYYCFSEKKGGDVISMVAHVRGTSVRDAALFLTGGASTQPSKDDASATPDPPETTTDGLKPLDYLEPQHEILELLGLTPNVCEALGAGYAPKGLMAGRIAIPLRLPDGTLVGYFGIATKPDQVPLLKFPANLAERCPIQAPPAQEEPPKHSVDEMRKLLRVV
jgi:hypothetical protein